MGGLARRFYIAWPPRTSDAEEAKRRGEDEFKFFGYALAHHYIFGEHKPGRTDIWTAYERARAALPEAGAARGIGTPEQLRAHLKSFEDSGVDQVAFIQQGGKNRHDHICQSLELFAREVLPVIDFFRSGSRPLSASCGG